MIVNQNKVKSEKLFKEMSYKDRHSYLHNIYYKCFIPEYNELLELKKSDLVSREELFKLNQFEKLNWRILTVLEILRDISELNISVKSYFKIKKTKISRASFFDELKIFGKYLCRTIINFENLFHKSTKPKIINYKYTDIQRKAIVNFINKTMDDSRNKGHFFNKTTVWLRIRKEGVLEEYGDFSRISSATIMKIYKEETGNTLVSNKCYSKKHKPRNSVKELGHIQMDLKVLGYSETGVGKYVYILDMIDTSSRLVFSKVLFKADVDHVIEGLKIGIDFFKQHGINIKSMQTDNAMMFKKTNFIINNKFHELLQEHNIKHRRISLGQPQSNGCVERYHLKIDKEAHYRLYYCETIEEVSKVIDEFMYYHNNLRYHYYYELGKPGLKLPHADRFMKPIDAIKIISWYYYNNQSKMSM